MHNENFVQYSKSNPTMTVAVQIAVIGWTHARAHTVNDIADLIASAGESLTFQITFMLVA